jgi:hypothetical protein
VIMKHEKNRDLIAYAGTVFLCVSILAWTMQLWRANLAVPFTDQTADDAFYGMVTKSLIDNGWYLRNDFLGAPEGVDLQDFPITDTVHLALLKFITLWTHNYAVALNLFFLFTFPLTAITSLYAFRAMNLSYGVATVCSLLFTFLPYHFFRGEVHVLLAAYYFVPLMGILILWMGLGTNAYGGGKFPRTELPTPKYAGWSAKLICVLVASAGTYYAFLGGFLLLVAAAFRARRDRSLRPLVYGAALIAILVIVTFANVAPSIAYAARHGFNPEPVARTPGQAEYYGLKVLTLVLPVTGHRIPAFARLKSYYNAETRAVNENDWATLGIFGTAGFFMLLGWLAFRSAALTQDTQFLDLLSTLNVFALLLALTGGFAILVAGIFPEIRSYNRMSLYIAFFSLAALGVWLDNFLVKRLSAVRPDWSVAALLGAVLLAGILDQTTAEFVPQYEKLDTAYTRDAEFFERVESSLPQHAMIFELPYAEFPGLHRVWGYELLRGYLHTRTLRWSYGVVSGRAGDAWLRRVTAEPLPEMLATIAVTGFDGIYIDRSGYADGGPGLIDGLERFDLRPLTSADKRLVFFNLQEFRNTLRRRYGEAEWLRRRAAALRELGLQPGAGY